MDQCVNQLPVYITISVRVIQNEYTWTYTCSVETPSTAPFSHTDIIESFG